MQPLPNLNKIFSLEIQQERQFPTYDGSKILAGNVDDRKGQNRSRGGYTLRYNNRNGSKVCTHCKKTGHTIDTCYKKHGFPPNWQRNSANAASIEDVVDQTEKEEERVAQSEITQEQYEKLINLLQGSSTSGTSTSQANFVTKHGMHSFDQSQVSSLGLCI